MSKKYEIPETHAFPRTSESDNYGLTMRDYFAAAALVAVEFTGKAGEIADAAFEAYQIADAMIKERERRLYEPNSTRQLE